MMRGVGALTRALGLAALSIVILFGAGAVHAAPSNQAYETLAYDPGTDTLLKADASTLYRSGDGGQSWQKIAIPLDDGKIAAVAASFAARSVMYVAGPGVGVVRTEDGGKTWAERTEGLPSRDVIAVAAHTTQPDTVYAVVKEHGIYRSQDAGKSWRMMDRGPRDGLVQLIHSDMPGSMQSGWLFAATSNGVRRIMDCFCLWQVFVAMLSAGVVALVLSQPTAWGEMVFGPQWAACLFCVPLFAIAPFASLIWALRSGAPTNLVRTGAIIGLVAGALGAAVFAFHHPDGSIPFIALWYGGPIVLCALVGAILGPKLLRW